MAVLPPGTILQFMCLRERIQKIPPGYFIEVGLGSGEIKQLLLDQGWIDCSYDPDCRYSAFYDYDLHQFVDLVRKLS